ncbi:MAG: helix-turn-helix domain-containing protein [Intestinibacter sp.]|uniref:helix-turn-helix domain-containing protein n=1 Tax=Intestinibacter sp. TaxID=1965304 RepID=UPI003F18BB90
MFGKRLAELRKENKITQRELANKLNISKSSLAMYETNKRQPTNDVLVKLADYFDVSVDYLLGRTIARKQVDTIAFHSIDDSELSDEGKEELRNYLEYLKTRHPKKD